MRLRGRLRNVETSARRQGLLPVGCPECRERRGRHVLVDVDQGLAEPAPCPRCGTVPEFVIEVVRPEV
jgi:hypothetical protein